MTTTTDQGKRRFLGMMAVAGCAPVAAKASAASALIGPDSMKSWSSLTYNEMRDMVGERFEAQGEGSDAVILELTKVEKLTSKNRPAWLPRKQPFNARFRVVGTPADSELQTVRVRHRQLGSTKLYLSEVQTPKGVSIESIFA